MRVDDRSIGEVRAVAPEFESGVDCSAESVRVGVAGLMTEVAAEPVVDLVGPPEPVATSGVGDGGWEATWSLFAGDEQSHALSCTTRSCCDVGHRDETRVGKSGDPDPFDGPRFGDDTEDGIFERVGVAVEVGVLDPIGSTDECIVAACFEDAVDESLTLKLRALDDEGEGVGGHVIPRSGRCCNVPAITADRDPRAHADVRLRWDGCLA